MRRTMFGSRWRERHVTTGEIVDHRTLPTRPSPHRTEKSCEIAETVAQIERAAAARHALAMARATEARLAEEQRLAAKRARRDAKTRG